MNQREYGRSLQQLLQIRAAQKQQRQFALFQANRLLTAASDAKTAAENAVQRRSRLMHDFMRTAVPIDPAIWNSWAALLVHSVEEEARASREHASEDERVFEAQRELALADARVEVMRALSAKARAAQKSADEERSMRLVDERTALRSRL